MAKKLIKAAIALAISFALWMYVVMVIGPEYKDDFRDVEVVIKGDLKDNLMILGDQEFTVDLKLSGNRADLNKLNSSNIIVELDLSQIQQEGKSPYRYEIVNLPDSVTIESSSPSRITLDVVERGEKTVDVEVVYEKEKIPAGYGAIAVEQEFDKIRISGPAEEIEPIKTARIQLDLNDKNNKTGIDKEEYEVTYLDEDGKKVINKNITPITEGADKITVSLDIGISKEIPLRVYVVEGGGITVQNVSVDPPTLNVLGSEEALQQLGDEWYINSKDEPLDLSTMTEDTVNILEIDLPEGVVNPSGYKEATVTVSFDGVITRDFDVMQEKFSLTGLPEGMIPYVFEKKITVTVRGAEATVNALTADDILVSADLSDAKIGMLDQWELTITIRDDPADAGVIAGPENIYVEIKDASLVAQQAGQEGNQGAVALLRT